MAKLQSLHKDTIGRRAYFTVWLCGEFQVVLAISALVETGEKHISAAVKNMVAEALGKIGIVKEDGLEKNALDMLSHLLRENYYRIRLHAAKSIGWVGAHSLLPELKEAYRKEWLADVRKEINDAICILESNSKK